jgi:4a-hydroxytetrahydrobiopterin dehydratase
MADKLSTTEVEAAIAKVGGWSLAEGKLHRDFKFGNFVEAFGFMCRAALVCEKMDHHPEWSNVYNKVKVDLVTHSAGGITELDIRLATRMNELAAGSGDKR